ncbi:hypothetical protein Bxe_A3888 [Paraburkholderia xenovorans LB400]|uniref:Uncharacterized protein n=1 Tax=Paraburkholderia xenovorans (strain LB400) TaxID=266265 RepID=Q144Y0_PARXL|nr:hypothetical protein Bxe_A3888 [Paraburkholderia xenovorans LB400]
MLELLIDTGEDYQREAEIDSELYQVIALDAKEVPQSRIKARHAANLLAKALRKPSDNRERIGATRVVPSRAIRFKTMARRIATAH